MMALSYVQTWTLAPKPRAASIYQCRLLAASLELRLSFIFQNKRDIVGVGISTWTVFNAMNA
jgi:hypothetical protein